MELSALHFLAIYAIGFFVSLMLFTWWIGYLYAKERNSSFWGMYLVNTLMRPGTLDFYQMKAIGGKLFLSVCWFVWWPLAGIYVLIIVPLVKFTSYVMDKVSHLGFIMGTPKAKSLTEPHPIEQKASGGSTNEVPVDLQNSGSEEKKSS
jgi:hypothetical protein